MPIVLKPKAKEAPVLITDVYGVIKAIPGIELDKFVAITSKGASVTSTKTHTTITNGEDSFVTGLGHEALHGAFNNILGPASKSAVVGMLNALIHKAYKAMFPNGEPTMGVTSSGPVDAGPIGGWVPDTPPKDHTLKGNTKTPNHEVHTMGGTSSGSVYVVVAEAEGLRIGARFKGTGVVSLRAVGTNLKSYINRLSASGFDKKDGAYMSIHLNTGTSDISDKMKTVGALLFNTGIKFTYLMNDQHLIKEYSK